MLKGSLLLSYTNRGMGRRASLICFRSLFVLHALATSVSTELDSDIALAVPFAVFSHKSMRAPSRRRRSDRLRLSLYSSTPFLTPRLTRRTDLLTRFSMSARRLAAGEEPFLFFFFLTLKTTGAPSTTMVPSVSCSAFSVPFRFSATFLSPCWESLLSLRFNRRG